MELVATLLVVGVILLLLETILPGMVAGVAGFCCVAAGVVVTYARFGPEKGNLVLLAVVIGGIGAFAVWLKMFPKSRVGRLFVSDSTVGNINAEKPELLHQTGTAFTNLRPCGTAVINGRRVDVVTEGGMIARGTQIKVVAIEGMRVVVRAISPDEAKVA